MRVRTCKKRVTGKQPQWVIIKYKETAIKIALMSKDVDSVSDTVKTMINKVSFVLF